MHVVEHRVRSLKQECLSKLILFDEASLRQHGLDGTWSRYTWSRYH